MNPRHIICTLLSAATLTLPSLASADEIGGVNYTTSPIEAPTTPAEPMPAERLALHIAPVFFVPVGSLADVTQAGGGAFVGLDIRLSSRFVVTARGGYVSTTEQSQSLSNYTLKSSVDFAPLLGGIKWYVAEPNEGFFLAGEAGPVLAIGSSRVVGQAGNTPINVQGSGTQANLGTAASLGYEIGSWDFRAGLMTLDVGHASNSSGVMASAAFSFARF